MAIAQAEGDTRAGYSSRNLRVSMSAVHRRGIGDDTMRLSADVSAARRTWIPAFAGMMRE